MKSLCLILLLPLLMACEGEDNRSVIRNGGENPRPPSPKPTDQLSNRVMLTLAALSELYEILDLTLNESKPADCAQRQPHQLEWNCREDNTRPASRQGALQFEKEGQDFVVRTSQPMKFTLRNRATRILGTQDFNLQLKNSRLNLSSSYLYQVAKSGRIVHYVLTWNIQGHVRAESEQFILSEAEVQLNVHYKIGTKENTIEYLIASKGPLELNDCGQVKGEFLFSGFEQTQMTVQSDGKSVHAGKAKGKYNWPECTPQLYNLKLTAPFASQPEP